MYVVLVLVRSQVEGFGREFLLEVPLPQTLRMIISSFARGGGCTCVCRVILIYLCSDWVGCKQRFLSL